MKWTDVCKLTYKLSGPLYPVDRGTVRRREEKGGDGGGEDAEEGGKM